MASVQYFLCTVASAYLPGCLFTEHLKETVGWSQQVRSVQQEAAEQCRGNLWLDSREQGLQFQSQARKAAANEIKLLRWRLEHTQTNTVIYVTLDEAQMSEHCVVLTWSINRFSLWSFVFRLSFDSTTTSLLFLWTAYCSKTKDHSCFTALYTWSNHRCEINAKCQHRFSIFFQ